MTIHLRRFALVSLLALAVPASADEVHLVNGNTLEGHTRKVGDEIVVVTPNGELRLAASEVREIVAGKTRHDRYEERRAALDRAALSGGGERSDDADAHVELGDWCRDQGLDAEARRHWRRAVELDANHRAAHGRLGHVRHSDPAGGVTWMTESEYYEARGFVREDGKWVHRDVVARRNAEREREKAFQEHQKRVQKCVLRMQSRKRSERLTAKVELQEYAEEIGDLRLAAFASDVADHYNAQWRAIRNQYARGSALTEVRATQATLKRPIPVFTTSLGANSTPVRIQLPELQIASIRTTALIPLGIELDEDD